MSLLNTLSFARLTGRVTHAALVATLLFWAGNANADGSETLGPSSLAIADGTGIRTGGVGLANGPGDITVNIPSGASIEQVILYWEGVGTPDPVDPSTDDTIVIGGIEVTGTLIGGPIVINPNAERFSSSYRADITALNLVSPGANTISVDGLDFNFQNSGAGLLVVIDDGGDTGPVLVNDGIDFAFVNAPAPRNTTVPQTFTFDAAPDFRTVSLSMFFSNLQGVDASSEITVTTPSQTATFDNSMSSNGEEWNTLQVFVDIAPGETSFTVVAESIANPGSLSSFTWVAAAASIPNFVNRDGIIGDRVWNDLNENGRFDSGEPFVSGVTIRVLDDVGNLVAQRTSGNEEYDIENIEVPGSYVVEFVIDPASGFEFTAADVGDDFGDSDAGPDGRTPPFLLTVDDPTNFSIDAGLVTRKAGIGDFVFEDTDGDGEQDAGEPGIDGVTVNLLDGTGAATGESQVTMNGGMYQFDGLDAGSYIIEFVNDPAANRTFSPQNAAAAEVDSDADPTSGRSGVVTLNPGDFDDTIDAGLVPPPPDAGDLPTCSITVSNRTRLGLLYLEFEDRASILEYIRRETVIEVPSIVTTAADHPDSAGPGSDDDLRNGFRFNDNVVKAIGSSRQKFFKVRNRKTREVRYFMKTVTKNVAELTIGDGASEQQCETIRFSPLALDLDGDGAINTSAAGIDFDFAGNGIAQATASWFSATDGILYDTAVAGSVTGEHLFGNQGGLYANGFEKLALRDANGDGVVRGAELTGLALWLDTGNGRVDAGELRELGEFGVVGLGLNHFGMRTQAELANGGSMLLEDVWFEPAAPVVNRGPWLWVVLGLSGLIVLGGVLRVLRRERQSLAFG